MSTQLKRVQPTVEREFEPETFAFERFTDVVEHYEMLCKKYFDLWSASCDPHCGVAKGERDLSLGPINDLEQQLGRALVNPDDIKALMASLTIPGDVALQAMWPGMNIYDPPRKYLGQRLALMVGAIPRSAPHSPPIFARMLLMHVAAEHPNAMVLESTCRQLEATKNNVPTICEVLAELREQQKKWKRRLKVDEMIRSGRAQELGNKVLARLRRLEQLQPGDKWDEGRPDSGSLEADECRSRSSADLKYRSFYNDPLRDHPKLTEDDIRRLMAQHDDRAETPSNKDDVPQLTYNNEDED